MIRLSKGLVFSVPLILVLVIQLFSVALAAEQIKLTMIAESRETHLQFQKEMVEAFEAQHPNVTVELVSTAGSGLVDKMQTMLAGGTPPDIGYMDPYLLVQWGAEGILENLTPYIEQEPQFKDWYQSAFNLYQANGKIYGLPQDLQIGAIFYNKTHYDETGLAYPDPDWTYADLQTNAKRLTVIDNNDNVTRYGFRIPTSRNWLPVLWAFGGDLLDSWNQPTEFTGNDPRVIEGLNYLHNLVEIRAVQDKETHNSVGTTAAFIDQNVSMELTNTIVLGHFGVIDNFEWDVVPLPHGPAGAVPFFNAIGWFMFSDSKHKKETWELLKFMTTPEALQRRVEIVGNVPPSRSMIVNSWIPSRESPAGRGLLLNNLDKARSPYSLPGRIFSPMNTEALKVIWGEEPTSSAIENMDQQVTALLAEDSK